MTLPECDVAVVDAHIMDFTLDRLPDGQYHILDIEAEIVSSTSRRTQCSKLSIWRMERPRILPSETLSEISADRIGMLQLAILALKISAL